MTAGPIQRGPVFKDRQLVLAAMEIIGTPFHRLAGVVELGFDAHGDRRQSDEQQCDEKSISHAHSFSLLIGEFSLIWLFGVNCPSVYSSTIARRVSAGWP